MAFTFNNADNKNLNTVVDINQDNFVLENNPKSGLLLNVAQLLNNLRNQEKVNFKLTDIGNNVGQGSSIS